MPDDKSRVGVASHPDFEIRRFAGKYDLSQQYVCDLIARVGNDRDELHRVAKELRVAAATF
jgi:hypothetical protein